MTREQKELLYEIANWTDVNFKTSTECINNIKRLETEYKEKYGPLPEWKYIDDVWAAMKTLKEELNG